MEAFVFPGNGPSNRSAQNSGYIALNILNAVGAILFVYGMPGLFARWRHEWGGLGTAGLALIGLVAMLFGVFLSLLTAIVLPWLAAKAPDLMKDQNGPPAMFVFFLVAVACLIVGNILMAIPILRGRVGPRWVGYLLIVSALVSIAGFFIPRGGPDSQPSLLLSLFSSLQPLLLFVAIATLGFVGATEIGALRAGPSGTQDRGTLGV